MSQINTPTSTFAISFFIFKIVLCFLSTIAGKKYCFIIVDKLLSTEQFKMQILCFKEIIKAVSQSLICQTLLLNLTGDELGHGGRDQQDSGSQGSQKMSGSATKKIKANYLYL